VERLLGYWGNPNRTCKRSLHKCALRQAALAREKAKEKEQARKDDTRRKILIGSCMLKITEEDEQARAKLITQMDRYLTDERDRTLFNLDSLTA